MAGLPKMDKVLQALEDTREFLEQRYDDALDDDQVELAEAYRYALLQLRGSLINDSLFRGLRYLATWAHEANNLPAPFEWFAPDACEGIGRGSDVGASNLLGHVRCPTTRPAAGRHSTATQRCILDLKHLGVCRFNI